MAYHMRRADREITDGAAIDSIICNGMFAMCALCRDNEPYAVTLSYGYDPAGRTLYFHCAQEGLKLDIIRANPAACLTIIDDLGYMEGECSHAYKSVVVRGKFEFIESETERVAAIRTMVEHYEKDPMHVMIKVDTGTESWRNTRMLKLVIESVSAKTRPIKKRKAE